MSSTDEKLCLQWNDFQENVKNAFGQLRGNNDFVDVTLACEDGRQIEAHKVILASLSPFFQRVLKRNKHSHPLIYMKGMKSDDLTAIVDFLSLRGKCLSREPWQLPCNSRGTSNQGLSGFKIPTRII